MGLSLKPEVRFPEATAMAVILVTVEREFARLGYETVITSGQDGKHKDESLHYLGLALDFRTRHMAEGHEIIVRSAVKAALPQCDVLLEGLGTPNEHLHVEWDVNHDNNPKVIG